MRRLILPLFVGNSIHIAAGLESALSLRKDFTSLELQLLASKTHYPSRMSRTLDSPTYKSNRFFTELGLENYFKKVTFVNTLYYDEVAFSNAFAFLNDKLQNISNVSDLSLIEYNNVNLGGVLANAYAFESTIDTDKGLDIKLLRHLLRSYLEVYFHAQKVLKDSTGALLVYNGRFIHERAFVDAARLLSSELWVYETTQNRYHLRNEGFHDRKRNQIFMINHWERSTHEIRERMKIASEYFQVLKSPRNRFFTSDEGGAQFSFMKFPYIVYYSNSDDEAIGFWESWKTPLGSQIEVVKQLIDICSELKIHLVIRLHPNLNNKAEEIQAMWRAIPSSKSCTIIDPSSNVSSYTLLENSVGVLSFGSTIGLEAAYYKKPSAVLADCLYDELGAVDKIVNFEDLKAWITNVASYNLAAQAEERRTAACIRGYWQRTGGNPFVFTVTEELSEGAFRATRMFERSMRAFNQRVSFPILFNYIKRIRYGLKLR